MPEPRCVCRTNSDLHRDVPRRKIRRIPASTSRQAPTGSDPLTPATSVTEFLKLIRSLQERVEKLEAAQAACRSLRFAVTRRRRDQTRGKHDPSTSDDPHVLDREPVVKDEAEV